MNNITIISLWIVYKLNQFSIKCHKKFRKIKSSKFPIFFLKIKLGKARVRIKRIYTFL